MYLANYMDLSKLKWNTFTDDHFDLCQGIVIHYSPGHTPGLCIMQVNLEKDGTFIWTTVSSIMRVDGGGRDVLTVFPLPSRISITSPRTTTSLTRTAG